MKIPTIDNPYGIEEFYLVSWHVYASGVNKCALFSSWVDVLEFKHTIKHSNDWLNGIWKCKGVNMSNGETKHQSF